MTTQKLKPEKCSGQIRVRLGDQLLADLKTLAAQNGFDELSPMIRKILREHLYGHATPNRDLMAHAVRDE